MAMRIAVSWDPQLRVRLSRDYGSFGIPNLLCMPLGLAPQGDAENPGLESRIGLSRIGYPNGPSRSVE